MLALHQVITQTFIAGVTARWTHVVDMRRRDLLRAADSAAGSECRAAGKIPGIFVDNSNHQKRSHQDRDKDQPPVAARFLRLVHLDVPGCFAASTAASRPSFQWIDGATDKVITARFRVLGLTPCGWIGIFAVAGFAIPSNRAHAHRQSRDGLKAPETSTPDRHQNGDRCP